MINAIETRSVSKVYRTAMETSVGLHDLSMEIGANQFAALVGPNGSQEDVRHQADRHAGPADHRARNRVQGTTSCARARPYAA
ncbi:hypothetical protein LP420_15970 [Massilia sp. B-10]|nr:hypothetical protein LP420_15970 [Massilia sp. B-10]